MSPSEILEAVREVAVASLAADRPIHADTHLLRDLELDSLKQLTFIVELENRFQLSFEPGEENGLETVGDIVALVSRRLAEPAGRP